MVRPKKTSLQPLTGKGFGSFILNTQYYNLIQVREENPILYRHKTQLNIKLSLLQYYNHVSA